MNLRDTGNPTTLGMNLPQQYNPMNNNNNNNNNIATIQTMNNQVSNPSSLPLNQNIHPNIPQNLMSNLITQNIQSQRPSTNSNNPPQVIYQPQQQHILSNTNQNQMQYPSYKPSFY
jgi:hypothetical protein